MHRSPMLSAALYDRFESFEKQQRDASERDSTRRAGQPHARWRSEHRTEGSKLSWGFYFEETVAQATALAQARAAGQRVVNAPALPSHAVPAYPADAHAAMPSPHLPLSPPQSTMALKTHVWVSLWFLVTIPVIFWDSMYLFLRPRSFEGGDLHWIWQPYGLYQNIDYVYGVRAWEEHDGFPNAQASLNIVENLLNIAYLCLAHAAHAPTAPLIGFASAVMTLSKTLLYWLQEGFCGGCAVGHNNLKDLIVLWVIPNGLWIVVPSLVVWRLGKDIAASLRATDKAAKKAASGKTQ